MDEFSRLDYLSGMASGGELRRIVGDCLQFGTNLALAPFEQACRLVAERLDGPLEDPGLADHFALLLAAGDRFAAVNLLVPMRWAYSISRDFDGQVRATIRTRKGLAPIDAMADDEGIALLAALALAVQSGPNVVLAFAGTGLSPAIEPRGR